VVTIAPPRPSPREVRWSGSTTVRQLENSNWRTNGIVEDAAPGFEEWIGRSLPHGGHFDGVILDGVPVPSHGDGIFRLD
jgi:hypothetical protein